MSGSEDTVPAPTQNSDGPLDDAALDHVSGGRLAGTDAGHSLSWSDLLTDPNVTVPFHPAPHEAGTGEASLRPPRDANDNPDDDPKPATNIAYANW